MGDTIEVISVCGEDGNYNVTLPDGEVLELPYEAETRIMFMNFQINSVDNDATAVTADDIVKEAPDYDENTDFERLWPILRDNLLRENRIKTDFIPENVTSLWMSQKAELIKDYNDK